MATNKGFIKDIEGNYLLPITRGELVLDSYGKVALHSNEFLATETQPGLMSAAEKAMLSGSGSGQSLSDIYTKLEYINNGLKFNNLPVNFYDSDGKATPITITPDSTISINVNGNNVNLGLAALTTTETSVSQILKSITVDKYGRVTAVSGSTLTNDDIPETLSDKKLVNAVLTNGKTATSEIEDEATAIANKNYVDLKFNSVNNIATGALKFVGPISSADDAITIVTELKQANSYYKATKSFTIPAAYLYSETESTSSQYVKIGDTLIVYPVSSTEHKWVYVPSGDEQITTLTVLEENATAAIDGKAGNLKLLFSSIFNVIDPASNGLVASIDLPAASANQSGHLTAEDWIRFNSYADSLKVTYDSNVLSTASGVYSLGTLTVGTDPYTIYGLNNISALELKDNTDSTVYNPILKFTETGTSGTSVEITYKGTNGIEVLKDGNDIQFRAANQIYETSAKYLNTNGYQFGVTIGSKNGTTVNDGLTDYKEFNEFRTTVATAIANLIEIIDNSLTDTTETYYYGSTALVNIVGDAAITI